MDTSPVQAPSPYFLKLISFWIEVLKRIIDNNFICLKKQNFNLSILGLMKDATSQRQHNDKQVLLILSLIVMWYRKFFCGTGPVFF